MSTSSKPAIHQILETHLFSREEAYASRIHELEAVLDFVVQFNHGILPPLTHRWEYSLWPDGTLKEIAPTCELYTGFSRSDFLRNPDLLFSIVVPEDRERFRSHLQTVLNHPESQRLGYKITARSGQVLDIFQESMPAETAPDSPQRRVIIAQVQTSLNAAAPQSMSTEKAWQYLVENNPDLIIMIDRSGRFLYSNRPLRSTDLDYTLWKDIETTVIPEHRGRVHQGIEKVFESGEPVSYELASPTADGQILWYMTHVGPVMAQNKVIGALLMIRDITQLKKTEQKLNRWNEELEARVDERTRQLKESNERLRAISELIPDYVYSARIENDGARSIEWISGAFEQITGYTLAALQQAGGWSRLIHPQDLPMVTALSESFSAQQPTVLEYRIVTRSGEVRWIQDHNKPIFTQPGQPLNVWGAVQDITDRKVAAETLQRYAQRLEASVKLAADLRQVEEREQALSILVNQSTRALHADIGGIYLKEKSGLSFAAGCGLQSAPPIILPADENHLLQQVLRHGPVQVVSAIQPAELGCEFCEFLDGEGIQTLALAPLRTASASIGVLYVGFRMPAPQSPSDLQLLDSFAEVGGNTLHRFEAMQQLEHSIRQREHELAVLYEVMSVANQTSDLDLMVDRSLQIVLAAVGCEIGVIMLTDPKDGEQKVVGHRGWTGNLCEKVSNSSLREAIGDSFHHRKVVFARTQIEDDAGRPLDIAFLGSDITSKGVSLGRLGIYGPPDHLEDPSLSALVSSITDQLAIAVESARLRKQAEETAIIEERQRLARDLHDSVSQSLYGLVISADVGSKLLRLKEYSHLKETLHNIENGSLQALREMRLMLFEMRPLSLESEGLVKALDLRLNTVEQRAGISAALTVEGDAPLSAQLELDFYRVATEALNNALKHANADDVAVTLRLAPQQIELEVRDNGDGFDVAAIGRGGIGLSSMRERAQRLGGALTITSRPGGGTTVNLQVPAAEAA
jgi:PAS domain S-box-containing protein